MHLRASELLRIYAKEWMNIMLRVRKVVFGDLARLNEAINSVCREEIYLATSRGFSLEQQREFLQNILAQDLPLVVAEHNSRIIGWCDIIPRTMEGFTHVGYLGMGVIKPYRGEGLGHTLLSFCLDLARRHGLEKVELEVFSDNIRAIELYKKNGFFTEGIKRKVRKIRDGYQDIQLMAVYL